MRYVELKIYTGIRRRTFARVRPPRKPSVLQSFQFPLITLHGVLTLLARKFYQMLVKDLDDYRIVNQGKRAKRERESKDRRR